jgi:hypothetical protein
MSTGETTINNDPYKDIAKVTTAEYDVSSIGKSDVMLRGFVPKDDIVSVDTSEFGFLRESLNTTSYQVYLQMQSNDWHYWNEARYKVGDAAKEIELNRIGSDVSCNQYGCIHYEDVAGPLSRENLETIAEQGGTTFRVYSGQYSNVSKDLEISAEEVQDFLDSVDRLEKKTSKETAASRGGN